MNPLGTVRLCTRQISTPASRNLVSSVFPALNQIYARYVFTLAVSRECLKRILKRNIMRTYRRNRGTDLCFIAGPRLDKYGGRHPPPVQP